LSISITSAARWTVDLRGLVAEARQSFPGFGKSANSGFEKLLKLEYFPVTDNGQIKAV